jgi:hypothetical protein
VAALAGPVGPGDRLRRLGARPDRRRFCYPSPHAVEWNIRPKDVDFAHERLWDWRDPQLMRLLVNGPVSGGFRTTP